MNTISVLKQLYIDQGRVIVGKQTEQMTYQQPKYHMCLVMSVLIGLLVGGVVLASVVTLYIKEQSYATASTTNATNQTSSSVVVKQIYHCAGVSPYTLWQMFGSQGITMSINTNNCSFNSTPLYFTSVSGITDHWGLASYGAIYVPTNNSFTIYGSPLFSWTNTQLFTYSQTYKWNINWVGITY